MRRATKQSKTGHSNIHVHQNPSEGLLKHRLLDATPRDSNSVGLGWGPKTCCLFNKLLGDADTSGPGTVFLRTIF